MCPEFRLRAAMSDERSPSWGQLVVGPPGAGKTTYCHAVQQFLRAVKRCVGLLRLLSPVAPSGEALT